MADNIGHIDKNREKKNSSHDVYKTGNVRTFSITQRGVGPKIVAVAKQ